MLKNIKIGSKISILVIGLVILTVAAVSFIAYNFSRDSLQEKYLVTLDVIVDQKADKIQEYFNEAKSTIRLIQNLDVIKNNLTVADSAGEEISPDTLNSFIQPLINTREIYNIVVTSLDGRVIYSAKGSTGDKINDVDGRMLSASMDSIYFSAIFEQGDKYLMYAGGPLRDQHGELRGLLFASLDMEPVYRITSDSLFFSLVFLINLLNI